MSAAGGCAVMSVAPAAAWVAQHAAWQRIRVLVNWPARLQL